jgi:hypothetical protein
LFVVDQREQKKEEWGANKADDEKRRAMAEAAKDVTEEQIQTKEEEVEH